MAEMIRAPDDTSKASFPTVFLAGSVDKSQDASNDWRRDLFQQCSHLPVTFLDPSRSDWDSSWQQTIENEQFRKQVEWELDSLDASHAIVVYFAKDSQAPISLMELGLNARSGRVLVCCPQGFWKKGNVDVVCKKYGVRQFHTISDIASVLIEKYTNHNRTSQQPVSKSFTCCLS